MIRCEELFDIFRRNGFTFFSGVPDSTFKDWISFLGECGELKNMVAVNECEATAICAGYHLATGKAGVLYMQNAGEGKTVNPLTSLCDPEVYSIPVLLMIGWRGEPGKKDEPQHKKMGRIMIPLLDTLEIPYSILPHDLKGIEREIAKAREYTESNSAPYAIIIREGMFEEYKHASGAAQGYEMSREEAIKAIVDCLGSSDVVISTTGKISRELFEYREAKKQGHSSDFYTVGSMGCSAAIAFGIAIEKPEMKVFVFDGDGAVLMQMGSLATIGHYAPKNLCHIVFDNEAHDSTGGQPTVSATVNFEKVALACGYKNAKTARSRKELDDALKKLKPAAGPSMLVVKVVKGARKDLGRPTTTPAENKKALMETLKK